MNDAIYQVPAPYNEPVLEHRPGSYEREAVKEAIDRRMDTVLDIPMYIGGKHVHTDDKHELSPPHKHQHVLAKYSRGGAQHVKQAIEAALTAKKQWESLSFEERAAIFLRAAELISTKYRPEMLAATMLAQSKNVHQAEIDCVAELADFLRFNVQYARDIYEEQPTSPEGMWNRMEYRPLEGFVFAVTPFNFTAIAGNLPSAPALMGNTVVWKPADSQIYSASMVMEIFEEAGVPPGVINLIYTDGPTAGDIVFKHREFAGLHFTGSTKVFQQLWKEIGMNIETYRQYPRIVGETGGKDFIIAHHSSDARDVATAISRGAFEFQGQKCSAASRVYLPDSLYDEVIELVREDVESFDMGSPEDFENFITAVIDRGAYDKITGYIDYCKNDPDSEIVIGGEYDDSEGYFIHPTVVLAKKPDTKTMVEEIFGPVVTIYKYPDELWRETLQLLDQTSEYALTGAVFSHDRYALKEAVELLRHSAGNFYINDKPTAAVVDQQPFGGGRKSGTNDKAGSKLNLLRWVSARTIKETYVSPRGYRYPHMEEEFELDDEMSKALDKLGGFFGK
ncbi:MAG: L-glutamate gamma-semialdehyde dehydrogenase [Bacteroidota bacterium]